MVKRQRNSVWVLFAIFGLAAVVALFMFAGRGNNLTGNVIGSEGQTCDGNWVNITDWSECVNGNQTRTMNSSDSTNCVPPITEIQSCVVEAPLNLSINIESPTATTYETQSILISILSTAPSVFYTLDNGVTNETYTASVTKSLAEGTYILNAFASDNNVTENTQSVAFTVDLPAAAPECGDSSCNGDETCDTCPGDCGVCEEQTTTEETTTQEESTVQVPVTTESVPVVCTPAWTCTGWTECSLEGSQTRDCSDSNSCGTEDGKPELSQACAPPETCEDGLKNQDEVGVDCGGVCEKRCSIFVLAGSVVSGPIGNVTNFFSSNKTRAFLILGGVAVLAAGVVVYLVFGKKKKWIKA